MKVYASKLSSMHASNYVARSCLPRAWREAVELPPMLRCDQAHVYAENFIMWYSNGGTSSRVHYDEGDFLLTQIDGSKHVTLVDPLDSLALYAPAIALSTYPLERSLILDRHARPPAGTRTTALSQVTALSTRNTSTLIGFHER